MAKSQSTIFNLKSSIITIGSRGSDLALWQANHVKARLEKLGATVEIKIIKTQGDKIQNLSFDKLEGKGFFTKELEEALLNNDVDLAVHSHKDLPTESPKGLIIAAVSEREDPSELLLIAKDAVDVKQKFCLKLNAKVGTSSARRKAQLLSYRKDITIDDLRGNVPTRIQKLREKKYDAIMLAAAGVERLEIDLSEFQVEKLSPKEFIPAPAQGVLALQIREKDKDLFSFLQKLNNTDVAECIQIERKILNLFDGGCQLPLGSYCEKAEDENGEAVFKIWTSKAQSANGATKFVYQETKNAATVAKKIVDKINAIEPVSVFISRDERKHDFFFNTLKENKFSVSGKTLIETRLMDFERVLGDRKYDWIFFSSKNAVRYFFAKKKNVPSAIKIGVIGKATAEEVRKHNRKVDFIGSSTNTQLVGKQFASIVGSGVALFPQAKGSLKVIQQQFQRKEQVMELMVYETIKHNPKLETQNYHTLVFTSPSNVDAFFENNKLYPNQKVVAMGNATENALKDYKVFHPKQPPSFDDIGLVMAVMSL